MVFQYSQQHLNTTPTLTHLWRQLCPLVAWQRATSAPLVGQSSGDWLAAVLQGSPAAAGLRPQREVKEEEDGPGGRSDEAAITEVPQRDTGHGGQASMASHHKAADREAMGRL